MGRRANWLLSLAALGLALQNTGGPAVAGPPGPGPVITLTDDGLLVDWSAPWPRFQPRAGGALRVEMAGYDQTSRPGLPQLPFASVLVALPPSGRPVAHVRQQTEAVVSLPGSLANAPYPSAAGRDASGRTDGGAFAPGAPDPAAVSFPSNVVELQELGVAGGIRLARLTFYPLHRAGAGWRATTALRVEVRFNSPAGLRPSVAAPDALSAAVRAQVVNPSQVEKALVRPRRPAAVLGGTSVPAAAIEVNTPGLTSISYEALAATGFPVTTTHPADLHLVHAGAEIALEWDGNANSAFEPGERVLFYADPRFSRWTANDVYFLYGDAQPGLRMAGRSASPTGLLAGSAWLTQTAETNALYTPQCYCGVIPAGRDGDHWAWDALSRPGRPSASYPISLATVAATQPATLTVWLIGYTLLGHRVDVALNGLTLGSVEWTGQQAITATLPITAGLMTSGTNTVTLTLPGLSGVAVDGVWLDAFAVQFARGASPAGNRALFAGQAARRAYSLALSSTTGLAAYDVTDPNHPLTLSNVAVSGSLVTLGDAPAGGPHRYAVASGDGLLTPAALRLVTPVSATSGADYLIITAPDFAPALASLIALRQSQGLAVAVEDAQPIYDAFGDGRPDPAAIRAYLDNAYHSWSPRPTYVLLVGDGTFDPRHYWPASSDTFIPPYLADVDPWMGEAAADNRYVTVDGSDDLPDMLVGRLPVNSLAEAQAVADKLVQYETQPALGGWNGATTFVSDSPGPAADFQAESSVLATTYITAPYSAQLINYLPPTTTVTGVHDAILSRWQAGAGLISYLGHASIHQWSADRLFHTDDVAGLTNAGRLPVLLELTCFTGTFDDPGSATLDESLVRQPAGGAVAVWGATGLGVATGHVSLASGFLQATYQDGQPGLGAATLAGKLALAATGQNLDLLDTYLLLGDPATRLDMTLLPAPRIFLPMIEH